MSYCASLQTYQVINVLNDEYQRMKRFHRDSDGYQYAHDLYYDARQELRARGENPDEHLIK